MGVGGRISVAGPEDQPIIEIQNDCRIADCRKIRVNLPGQFKKRGDWTWAKPNFRFSKGSWQDSAYFPPVRQLPLSNDHPLIYDLFLGVVIFR